MSGLNVKSCVSTLLLAVLSLVSAHGEQALYLTGVVTDQEGRTVQGVIIMLAGAGVHEAVETDANGEFRMTGITQGTYDLTTSHINYEPFQKTLTIRQSVDEYRIQLTEKTQQLEDVVIVGKSGTEESKDQLIRAAVVDTRVAEVQPATLAELMNRTAGVRIRQSGGLGSSSDVSINGFQGRAVRYFKDGIPIDYLGDGYTIATVPLNMLERIEIYKGVLPVMLGADALGGAVNMVSRQTAGISLNASYEVASFNTHRASVGGTYRPANERWFIGADAFYNHSDNDYDANVRVATPSGNAVRKDMRMFHNGFESYYAEVYAGLQNRRWADELRFGLSSYAIEREQQHPAMMTIPFGGIMGKQKSLVPTLRYKKSAFKKRLHIDQFLVANNIVRNRIDTVGGWYDWYGNFTRVPGRAGESVQPANSHVNFRHFISRSNIRYHINTANEVELNMVHAQVKREGSDPLGPRFLNTNIDVLSIPADYQKQVVSAGWTLRLLDERLTNSLIGKYYRYGSRGTDAWNASGASLEDEVVLHDDTYGVGNAIKYKFDEFSSVRVSVEYANRLPEQDELFGDGVWRVPNFRLQPETSLNFNAGYRMEKDRITVETNTFFRKTEGLILLIPVQPPYSQYVNMDDVRGYGLETDVILRDVLSYFTLNANFTWQDIRMTGIDRPIDRWKNGTRLRNTPYFFANLGITADISGLFFQGDRLKPYAHFNFVREFYLDNIPKEMEPDGFLGLFGPAGINELNLVPDQHLLSVGFAYLPWGTHYTLGFEVKNITDADLYDVYRIQRAGRSIHLKINYQF